MEIFWIYPQHSNNSGFGFHLTPSLELENSYHFKWPSNCIKYVGVKLTKDMSQLYEANYTSINQKINDDLDR